MSQEMVQQLLCFARKHQPKVVHAWLASSAEVLLQRGVLSAASWAELLLQEPWLLLKRPPGTVPCDFPRPGDVPDGELQVPLALPSLPAEQQVAVVRAVLQHWHSQVGHCCFEDCARRRAVPSACLRDLPEGLAGSGLSAFHLIEPSCK